jgi:hypothetical protein
VPDGSENQLYLSPTLCPVDCFPKSAKSRYVFVLLRKVPVRGGTSEATTTTAGPKYSTTRSGALLHPMFILASCHAPVTGGVLRHILFFITSGLPVPDGTGTQCMCPPHVVSLCIPVDCFSVPKLAVHCEYRTTPSGVLLHPVFILASCHALVSLQGVFGGILGTSSFYIITICLVFTAQAAPPIYTLPKRGHLRSPYE